MYNGSYVKGLVSIGDFIRYDKGAEIYYEVVGGDTAKAMTSLQAQVSRVKAKTKMQKFLLVDDKAHTVLPMIKVTLVTPARPKQKAGVKKGSKRK